MCKRKIKTVKVLLSLLLFAAVMFQIPSDVHAQVETMTTNLHSVRKQYLTALPQKHPLRKKQLQLSVLPKPLCGSVTKLPCVPLSL